MNSDKPHFIKHFLSVIDNVLSEFLMIGSLLLVLLAVLFIVKNQELLGEYLHGPNHREIPQDTSSTSVVNPTPTSAPDLPVVVLRPTELPSFWTDEELWEAFNQKRRENGINELKKDNDLCRVTNHRLQEALSIEDIDDRQSLEDLTSINSQFADAILKYSNVLEVVSTWNDDLDNTLSQWETNPDIQQILIGGEFVWGCASSAHSFTVIMVAF
ncbi:hypothetical protein ACFL2C_01360 [Patescibacteria group bacterium]